MARHRMKHRHEWANEVEYAAPLPPNDRWWVHYITKECYCGFEHIRVVNVR